MKRGLGIVMVLAILSLSLHGLIGNAVAQDATPTTETVMTEASPASADECVAITDYARVLVVLGAGLAAASYGLPTTAVSQWSDEIYTKLIGALTLAIAKLTGTTAPEAAQKLNSYAIEALQAIQSAIVFLRTSGIGASLPFGDQLDSVGQMIGSLVSNLESSCPGLNQSLATPVASPAGA